MRRYITFFMGLFIIHSIQTMQNINNENRSEHMRISNQAAQLINSDIDENSVAQWKDLLKEAQHFQKENPKFPYLLLGRRPGQGPDVQSIISAAPVVIDLIHGKCIEKEKLEKLRYTLGTQYILKLLTPLPMIPR